MDSNAIDATIRWVFFNTVLALLPIIITFVIAQIVNIQTQWYSILKDGELYLFSTTISASSIGSLIFRSKNNVPVIEKATKVAEEANLSQTLTICSLVLVLILSTVAFGITSYLKLKSQPLPDERKFSVGSIGFAVVAALLGYVAFTLTDMK